MKIDRIYTKKVTEKKQSEKNDNEILISLSRENKQLKERVDELEKGLEEMLAVANLIL